MTISSATVAALSQPQPIPAQMPANQSDWQQFASTLNQWLQYLQGPTVPFTPTIAGTGGGTPTYVSQLGLYVKRGSTVTVMARVDLSATGGLSGNVYMNGLPTTQSAIPMGTLLTVYSQGISPVGGNSTIAGYMSPGQTEIIFIMQGSGVSADLQGSQLANACTLLVSGTYQI